MWMRWGVLLQGEILVILEFIYLFATIAHVFPVFAG
jgi:hypothetical protein